VSTIALPIVQIVKVTKAVSRTPHWTILSASLYNKSKDNGGINKKEDFIKKIHDSNQSWILTKEFAISIEGHNSCNVHTMRMSL
jgi:hypothetical protein